MFKWSKNSERYDELKAFYDRVLDQINTPAPPTPPAPKASTIRRSMRPRRFGESELSALDVFLRSLDEDPETHRH